MADGKKPRSSIDSALASPTAIIVVGRGTGSRSGHMRVGYRLPDADSHELVIVKTEHTYDHGPYYVESTEEPDSPKYFIEDVYPMSEMDTAKERTKRLAQWSEDGRYGMFSVESDHATFKLYKVVKGKYTKEQELSEENGDIVDQDFAGGDDDDFVYDPPVELCFGAIWDKLRGVESAVSWNRTDLASTDPIRHELQWNQYVANIVRLVADIKTLRIMELAAVEREKATKGEIDQQNPENSRVLAGV
jgi:hypothetical protein